MNLRYPERLLQPWKDLRQFSQELYAMLRNAQEDVSGGIDVDTPPVKVGEQSFRVQRKSSGELNLVPEAREKARPAEASEGPRRFSESPARRREPEGRVRRESIIEDRRREASEPARLPDRESPRRRETSEPARQEEPTRVKIPEPGRARRERTQEQAEEASSRAEPPELAPPFRDRTTETEDSPRRTVEPIRVEVKPQEPGVKRTPFPLVNVGTNPDYPTRQVPSGGGSGTTVFIGKVLSGSGDTYSVALYPDGRNADAGDTVTVKIPVIDPDETIVHDTWLYSIFEFTDADGNLTYDCQPPIWMA